MLSYFVQYFLMYVFHQFFLYVEGGGGGGCVIVLVRSIDFLCI